MILMWRRVAGWRVADMQSWIQMLSAASQFGVSKAHLLQLGIFSSLRL